MGATSGIGKEVAILLADKGWIVGIAGRRTELLQRLQTQHKGIACWECIDVTQDDASGRLLQLIDRLGGMDLYFHSSGIGWQNNSLDEYKEMKTLLAPIVQVCDAISGARPGARREIVEAYIKRLNDLEAIAMSYPGVTKTYAIQAGRELRVIVGADKMDDASTEALSGEIANKIQTEMTYPGQVKITVIRETRSVAYAK